MENQPPLPTMPKSELRNSPASQESLSDLAQSSPGPVPVRLPARARVNARECAAPPLALASSCFEASGFEFLGPGLAVPQTFCSGAADASAGCEIADRAMGMSISPDSLPPSLWPWLYSLQMTTLGLTASLSQSQEQTCSHGPPAPKTYPRNECALEQTRSCETSAWVF